MVSTGTPVVIRVQVDPIACDAYGYCAELLPERVTLDEWGYPIVDGSPLSAELVGLATRAANACPRRAVLLHQVPAGPTGGRRPPAAVAPAGVTVREMAP